MAVDVYKALGDPTRKHMVELLAQRGEMTAGQIAACFSMSAPTISHHLSILRHAGLVQDQHVRQTVVYRLNGPALHTAAQWLDQMAQQIPDVKE